MRRKRLAVDRVYALKGYTIKCEHGKFFVCRTDRMAFKKRPWSGPYKSLHHATSALARLQTREFVERDTRLQQNRMRANA